MISNRIYLPIFICSFAIGLFFVYILGEDSKVVYVYPTPDTSNNILFKDYVNNCFQYTSKSITCPANKNNIHQIPIITK